MRWAPQGSEHVAIAILDLREVAQLLEEPKSECSFSSATPISELLSAAPEPQEREAVKRDLQRYLRKTRAPKALTQRLGEKLRFSWKTYRSLRFEIMHRIHRIDYFGWWFPDRRVLQARI